MKNQQIQHMLNYNQYKETKYCILLNQAEIHNDDSPYTYCIQKIYVREPQQEEIRLALYKRVSDKQGKETTKLVPRPVDLTEPELL